MAGYLLALIRFFSSPWFRAPGCKSRVPCVSCEAPVSQATSPIEQLHHATSGNPTLATRSDSTQPIDGFVGKGDNDNVGSGACTKSPLPGPPSVDARQRRHPRTRPSKNKAPSSRHGCRRGACRKALSGRQVPQNPAPPEPPQSPVRDACSPLGRGRRGKGASPSPDIAAPPSHHRQSGARNPFRLNAADRRPCRQRRQRQCRQPRMHQIAAAPSTACSRATTPAFTYLPTKK